MRRALAAAAVLAVSATAQARTPVEDARPAEAERFFEEGKGLLAKGDWVASCALFDTSARLHEVAPVLVKVARCRAHEGRLAKAIEVYERALALAPWPELDRLVRAELFEAQRRAPSIHVTVVEPASGVSIRRDGRPLAPGAWKAALWTDVGADEHLAAEAAGYRTAWYDIKATSEGQVIEIRVALEREPPPPAPPPPPANVRRLAGFAAVGAGIAVLGVGAGFGAQFLVLKGSIFDGCKATLGDGRRVCPPGTDARYDDAVAARTRAEVLLGVGAALAVAGVVLVATAPKRSDAAPRFALAVQNTGLLLEGVW